MGPSCFRPSESYQAKRDVMSTTPRLTPQERIRLAKSLRKRATDQPGLKIKQRQELRRRAFNLMQINLYEAKLKKPEKD